MMWPIATNTTEMRLRDRCIPRKEKKNPPPARALTFRHRGTNDADRASLFTPRRPDERGESGTRAERLDARILEILVDRFVSLLRYPLLVSRSPSDGVIGAFARIGRNDGRWQRSLSRAVFLYFVFDVFPPFPSNGTRLRDERARRNVLLLPHSSFLLPKMTPTCCPPPP